MTDDLNTRKTRNLTYTVWALLFIIMSIASYNINQAIQRNVGIDDVFYASVFVPDFKRGENPLVTYENTKLRDFSAVYKVEVKTLTGSVICVGSNIDRGYKSYTTDDKVDPKTSDFDWFVDTLIDPDTVRGRRCSEVLAERPPQGYYITWSFDIILDNGVRLPLYRPERSNIFMVE